MDKVAFLPPEIGTLITPHIRIEAALPAPAQRSDAARTPPGNSLFEANHSALNDQKGESTTLVDTKMEVVNSSIIQCDLSPIQYLPVELLAKIFTICVYHGRDVPPPINEPTEPPISLCRVCRSWKNIAYNLPRLWSAVSIDMVVISSEALKTLPVILKWWFSRANHRPLTLEFRHRNRHYESVGETLGDLIHPFAHQFHHLDIDAPNVVGQFNHGPWARGTFKFPELKSVIMRDRVEVWERNIPLFPFAPLLQRLRMDGLSFGFADPLAPISLSWSQLTHLILINILKSGLWHQVLFSSPNLQHGLFKIYQDLYDPPTVQRAVLNHLVELTLAVLGPIDQILSPFDFPALVTLRIQKTDTIYDGNEDFWAGTTGRRFCQQLASPLRRLSLHGDGPFTLLLEATQHIVELDLSYRDRGRFLSFLHPDQSGHLLAPNVKVLMVQLPDECSESEATTIADVVKSRCARWSPEEGNGIERLVVFLNNRNPAEVECMDMLRTKLQPFVADGLLLEFKDVRSRRWFGRLDPSATEWYEGTVDLFNIADYGA